MLNGPMFLQVRINLPEDLKFHIVNGNVIFWDKLYNFPDMIIGYTEKNHNTKFGAIDLETQGSERS